MIHREEEDNPWLMTEEALKELMLLPKGCKTPVHIRARALTRMVKSKHLEVEYMGQVNIYSLASIRRLLERRKAGEITWTFTGLVKPPETSEQ